MPSYYALSLRDESLEIGNQRLRVEQITAANFTAQAALHAALEAATLDLALGVVAKSSVIATETTNPSDAPIDPNAQRERKWLVYYSDDVTDEMFQTEIPTADITGGRKIAFQDIADLTSAEWVAYKAAFENVVESPNGNDVTLRRAVHVGRKS